MDSPVGKQIKVVLFDHDDTLVGTLAAKSAQHKLVAKKWYGKELSDEEIGLHWGKPLSVLMGLLYGTDDTELAMERVLSVHKDFPKMLHDDTIKTLEKLHEAGKKLGVITATVRFSLEHDLKSLGIPRKLLDYTQTEEDTPYHKPDPRVFDPALKWLKSLGVRPDETLYVGDGLHDMKAALGAGLQFIGVGTGLVSPAKFEAQGAKAIRRLGDLLG